jgi:hypothetical protein
MLRWSLRPAFFILLLVVVSACSGSGCSGCSGCGLTPLANGFPQTDVIPNSASVRVTRPGLDFLGTNLGPIAGDALGTTGGVVTFAVPSSSDNLTVATANICQNATSTQCVADVNVAGSKLHIDAIAAANGPNMEPAIQISGTVPVKINDIPVGVSIFGINTCTIDIGVGNASAPNETYADVPVTAVLPIISETLAPRQGYAIIDTANATVSANISTGIVSITGGLCADIADALKSTLVSQITGPLQNTLKNELQTQLCTKANATATPPCPTGTDANEAGTCVFTDSDAGACLPTLLGLDGHLDLGSLVAKYSPGNPAAVDLVLAGAGAAQPTPNCAPNQIADGGACSTPSPAPTTGYTPNGLSLGMLGGMLANPTSNCVPAVTNTIPTGIPIPDELLTDTLTPWSQPTGPDINLALSGRFLTYAMTSVYNSGLLCLGVSTEQFQALSTGYVSVVVPSIKDLTFEPGKQSKPAAMAIVTRPQKAPTVSIGGGTDVNKDPLITITLPSFAIDFYVWSLDRYVRAFTFTSDVSVPVNLQTGMSASNPNDGIVPVLGDLVTANPTVSNSDLVWEQPTQIASALSSLLGGLVGQFLGKGFSPISLNSSFAKYGIALDLPSDAFRKLTKTTAAGEDDFVGLFANFATAPTMMIRTQAELTGTEIHPEALGLLNADRAKFPKLHVHLSSPDDDGTRTIEYATWIDEQPRSAWSTATDVVVDNQYLFLQGKHTLYAAARVAGHPESEDQNPVQIPFLIDVLAPIVALDTQGSSVTVNAYDYVSDSSALKARYRLVDEDGNLGSWTEWQPYESLGTLQGGAAQSLEVQIQDEAGNVADTNGLIRGRPDPTIPAASSACGCSTPGQRDAGHVGVLAAFGLVASLVILSRRRRAGGALVIGSLGIVMSGTEGCSCGSNPSTATETDAGTEAGQNCGPGCDQPCGSANLLGLIGEYTSYAVASDGTVWIAGYNDADVTNGLLYGDLVAGKYDTGKQQVDWVDVDGLPPEPGDGDCAPNPPDTWRKGLTDPGPDVGLWTSIQLDSNNNPMISYYDATNKALKFASSPDGGQTWNTHTVMSAATSDIGRYSKMLIVSGKPVIGFLVLEPGMMGWAQSRVVLATGNVAVPASASDWSMQNALVDPQTPCTASLCASGQVCVEATGECQSAVAGCTPSDCGASEAGIGSTPESCVTVDGGASCQAVITSTYVDTYPDTTGDYIALANGPQGIGIVVYDRTRGNLVGVASQGGNWTAQILDGQIGANSSPTRTDTGDVGIGASLAIDTNGDWNISYVNGWTEALEYMNVPGGSLSKPLAPEVVDDGLHLGGTVYSDGQHIVGDDSSVTVDASGNVRVVYMDATAGTLHEAVGAPASGGTHTWTVKAISQPSKFAGYFPHYVAQSQMIENWYRATDHTMNPPVVTGNVAFVQP